MLSLISAQSFSFHNAMLFEKDKLQVGTDVFINSKQVTDELNDFRRELIQWVLQIIETKPKTQKRKVF